MASSAGVESSPSIGRKGKGTLAGETILIVDDNPDVQILLGERVLPSYGYHILTATDGREGLWQIRTQKPDLILLDLRLPDMTGLDLLHILSSEGYDTPVILITAYGSELIAAQALRLGVRDYIIKPFTLDEIIESVERALTEHRLRRERNALTDHLHHCTDVLGKIVHAGEEIERCEDEMVLLRRLTEIAVSASRARAGRFFLDAPEKEGVFLVVAQDRPDQAAYLLRRREESPEVAQVLSTGQPQTWEPKGGQETKTCWLALPVCQAGRPIAALAVLLPEEAQSPDDVGRQILGVLTRWVGLILERADLREQAGIAQAQLEALGALSPNLLLMLDAQDRIVGVTAAVEKMTGQSPSEVTGTYLSDWVEQIEAPYGDLLSWYRGQRGDEQEPASYPFLFQDPQGRTRHAQVRLLLQRGEEGSLRRYLFFQDVTRLHELEQQIRCLRQATEEIYRYTQLGLFLTDLQGTILAADDGAVNLVQQPLQDLLGHPLWEAFAATEDRHRLPEEIARAHREGQGYVELHASGPQEETLSITTLLLMERAEAPRAIAVLVRSAHYRGAGPDVEGKGDEGDILGRSRVDTDPGA